MRSADRLLKRNWIGNRPVIMVRGENGDIHVLENRCAHRGAQICWQNTGKVADFTCPYHQWNYDLEGNLQGVPFRRGALAGGMPRDFDPKQNGIRKLRSVNRGGSVWATFAEDAPSFEDYCGPEVLAEIDHMLPGKAQAAGLQPPADPQQLEDVPGEPEGPVPRNPAAPSTSPSACGARIPSPSAFRRRRAHSVMVSHNEGKKKTEATTEMSRFREDLELLDLETVTPRAEFNRGRVGGAWVFPAAQFGIQANSLKTRHVIPRSPTEHELVFTYYGYEDDDEEMTRLVLKHANLLGPAGFVSMDDSEMLNQVQIGVTGYPEARGIVEMGGRDTEPADYMVTEVLIRSFYDYYRKAMGL